MLLYKLHRLWRQWPVEGLCRTFHHTMKTPTSVAKSTTSPATPIPMNAPTETPFDELSEIKVGNGISVVIVTTVGNGNPVATVITVTLEKAVPVGVKSAKTAVSVLCHRIWTPFALIPSTEYTGTVLRSSPPLKAAVYVKI
jgi:hypothetical protein